MDELHMMKYSRTTHAFILYDCPISFSVYRRRRGRQIVDNSIRGIIVLPRYSANFSPDKRYSNTLIEIRSVNICAYIHTFTFKLLCIYYFMIKRILILYKIFRI